MHEQDPVESQSGKIDSFKASFTLDCQATAKNAVAVVYLHED